MHTELFLVFYWIHHHGTVSFLRPNLSCTGGLDSSVWLFLVSMVVSGKSRRLVRPLRRRSLSFAFFFSAVGMSAPLLKPTSGDFLLFMCVQLIKHSNSFVCLVRFNWRFLPPGVEKFYTHNKSACAKLFEVHRRNGRDAYGFRGLFKVLGLGNTPKKTKTRKARFFFWICLPRLNTCLFVCVCVYH